MKLTHIDNACCIYESEGFKLLCDPWLTDGAFEGSWFHYPPLLTTFDYIKDVDALYISHLHPDHYDETILKQFRKDLPIITLDHGSSFLKRKLESLGFTNLVKFKDKETKTIGPFEVILYAPFVKHPFDHSELGNFLDSALVVKANGKTVLNANDNTPTVDNARMLKEKHGKFSVVQLKDSLAGAYPSCFLNLSHEEKLSEANRLIKRQLTAMCEVAKELETEWFQPFAGDYQLGGSLVDKNQYLGVSAKKFSAEFIANRGIKPLILNEQGSIDLETGELKATYRTTVIPYDRWIDQVRTIKYNYQLDSEPTLEEMIELSSKARVNLWKWQERLNFKPDYTIAVQIFNGTYHTMNLKTNDFHSISIPFKDYDLTCKMDLRLLKRIFNGESHWNSAEIGSHIDFIRKGPYQPDISAIMSFFHV